jgi:beta-N-acetylhexosaminidase
MAPPKDARELTGSLLVVGFEGTELPASVASLLARRERAGVVLFKRNIPDERTARALPLAVHAAAPPDLEPLVAIDQEGGRVARLPSPWKALPPMRLLGKGSRELAQAAARAVAIDLRALGINFNFAPVLDVDSNPANPVIGDRSFGSDPARVAELGVAFAAGLNEGGVLACGKHFPGHGDTDTDSHHDLPVVRHPRSRIEHVELVPFRAAARAGIDSLMTAHVVVEALDAKRPATLSPDVVTAMLRHHLHFAGVVISDDLEMRAIAAMMEIEASAVASIRAGCDALLVCKSEEQATRAHDALTREAETSSAFRATCEEAWQRLHSMRERARALAEEAGPPSHDAWESVEREVEALRMIEET